MSLPDNTVREIRKLFLQKGRSNLTIEQKAEKYRALCHAMQTGVMYELEKDNSSGTPKHLRTGINAAMCDHGALVKILMQKGIFTEDEYYDALIEMMQQEVDKYQKIFSERYGANIKLR